MTFNTFTNNWRAATFSGINNTVFVNNTISVGEPCTFPATATPFNLDPYGAYFSQEQGEFIYNNTISMAGASTWPSHKTYGIILNNTNNITFTGGGTITLNKNNISTDIGICMYQDNRNTQIDCNDISGCSHIGIAVWGPNNSSPGLISSQGSSTAPVGNIFNQTAPCSEPFDIASGSMIPAYNFQYYRYAGSTYSIPCVSSGVAQYTDVSAPIQTSVA